MEPSLQAFISGFKHCQAHRSLSIHSCFAPALLGFATSATGHSRRNALTPGLRKSPRSALRSKYDCNTQRNQYSSSIPASRTSTRKGGTNLHDFKARQKQHRQREHLEQLISTHLDPFLPRKLRSKRTKSWKSDTRRVEDLPEALLEARRQANGVNLLRFMAVDQGRPMSLVYISRSLLSIQRKEKTSEFYDLLDSSVLLDHRRDLGLDELTAYDIERQAFVIGDLETQDTQSLQPTASLIRKIDNNINEDTRLHDSFGYLWEALGLAVIDLHGPDPDQQSTSISFVHHILALMHSEDAVPLLTYEFDSTAVPIELRKPPYLYALRSRIMAFLSDSMLQSQQTEAVVNSTLSATSWPSGSQEKLDASNMPPAQPLAYQTWLELILWSCLHGHHFRETARIVSYAALEVEGPRWTMVGWEDMDVDTAGRTNTTRSDHESQSWLAQISGFSGAYSDATSVEIPRHVLSRELVLRVLYGVALLDPEEDLEFQRSAIQAFLTLAESSSRFSFDILFNGAIARLIDVEPSLCKLFSQSSTVKRSTDNNDIHETTLSLATSENTFLTRYNFLHFGFIKSVESGDVKESLKLLEKLRNLVDLEEKEFSAGSKASSVRRSPSVGSKLRVSVPESTVALLLDQLTRAGHWSALEKLIDSAGSEGSIIPKDAVDMPCFQPPLLRYASAAPDWKLFSKVIKAMTAQAGSFPINALRALFEAQVTMHRFFQARKLLAGAARERLSVLGAKEIAVLAREYMKLSQGNDNTRTLANATHLFEGIFNKGHIPSRDPSKPIDYVPLRILNQMIRILGTIEGPMGELANKHIIYSGPGIADIDIDPEAFNILLHTVTVLQGREEARKLFNEWARLPSDSDVAPTATTTSPQEKDYVGGDPIPFGSTGDYSRDYGKVVEPNAETMRIVFGEPEAEPIDDEDDFGVEADHQPDADLLDETLKPYVEGDVEEGIMKQQPIEMQR